MTAEELVDRTEYFYRACFLSSHACRGTVELKRGLTPQKQRAEPSFTQTAHDIHPHAEDVTETMSNHDMI